MRILISLVLAFTASPWSISVLHAQQEFTYRTVATGLVVPWEIEIGKDGTMWTTERNGLVSRIDLETGDKTVILDIRDRVLFRPLEVGLLGFTWHPDFPDSPYVYVASVNGTSIETSYRLVERYRYEGDSLVNPVEYLRLQPAEHTHQGCRLRFGQDRKLYITMGDQPGMSGAGADSVIVGKVLRMNPDGTVPADNPIPGNLLYTKGHRNVQGWTQLPDGTIFTAEHGNVIEDEVNRLVPNGHFGWPEVEGVCDEPWEEAFCDSLDVIEPWWSSGLTETIAPCGMEYYNHDLYPSLSHSLLLMALKNSAIYQFRMHEGTTEFESTTIHLQRSLGRLRDLAIDSTGRIFVCTSNREANAYFPFPLPEDDRIVELIPVSEGGRSSIESIDTVEVQGFPGDQIRFGIPIMNSGDASLTVINLWKADQDSPIYGDQWRVPVVIPPGMTYNIAGMFSPADHGAWLGELRVSTADLGDRPVFIRANTSVGMLAPVRDTVVVSSPPGFGRTFKMRYQNIGVRPIDLLGAEVEGQDQVHFEIASVPSVTLHPQDSVFVTVRYQPTEPGDHEAAVRVLTSSYRDTMAVVIGSSRTTSVAINESESTLEIYPNPSSSAVTIRLPDDVDQGSLAILDAFGSPVFETTIVGTRAFTWNGRTRAGRRLASGMYVVALSTPYGVYHSPLQRVR